MAKKTITVEADSLQEARKKAESQAPKGFRIASEEIISDGKPKSKEGIADTTEDAFKKAESQVPPDAEVIEKKQEIAPSRKVVTIEAFDEETARAQVKRDIVRTIMWTRMEDIKLKKPGKKGFLGVGKKPSCYEAQVFEQAVVKIKYKKKAKISVKLEETLESWAQKLSEKKDYRTLIATFYSEDYDDPLRWDRQYAAGEALQKAGSEAVDVIMKELAKQQRGGDVAELLVEIGDPKAVPLLKRMLDRGDFAGQVTIIGEIKEFIQKHPDRIGPVETAKCLICGKVRPVNEMRGCDEEKGQVVGFCARTCWRKRGRIWGSEDGAGCPYYSKDRMCVPPVGEPSPCTFKFEIGPSFNTCHVYRTYPRI